MFSGSSIQSARDPAVQHYAEGHGPGQRIFEVTDVDVEINDKTDAKIRPRLMGR